MKLAVELLLVLEVGLKRLEQEARRRFCISLEGVEAVNPIMDIRWFWLAEESGDIMEDTARLRRLLVGVLLKLNARLTWKYIYSDEKYL